jgi:type III secretion protein T
MVPGEFSLFLLAFARVASFMMMLPPLATLKIPRGIRFIVYLSITPFMIPGLVIGTPADMPVATFGAFLLKEVVVGLFLGWAVSLPLRLPQLIGDLIDNQRGAAVTQQYNPSSGDEASILGQLLMWSVVAYFFSEHGFDYLIGILAGSFGIQPVTSMHFVFADDFFVMAIQITTNYLQLFGVLALPTIAVMFAADMTLGMASKFAPTMNTFSLSQPIKAVVALSMLIMIHPRIVKATMAFFDHVASYAL